MRFNIKFSLLQSDLKHRMQIRHYQGPVCSLRSN